MAALTTAVVFITSLGACRETEPTDADTTLKAEQTTEVPRPSSTPSNAVPSPTTTADDTRRCNRKHDFTGEATERFGADEVEDAYCLVTDLQLTYGAAESLVRASAKGLTVEDFTAWTPYMVGKTAEEWTATVTKALRGDPAAQEDVYTLMYYQAIQPGTDYEFTDQPAVLHRAVTRPVAAVDSYKGTDRLVLRIEVTGDFNFVEAGTTRPYYTISSTRDVTFGLVRNPEPTSEDADWLIQSWTGTYQFGALRPRGQ